MDALITISPEAQELIAFAQSFLSTAQAIRITSTEDAQAAIDQTRAIKECAKTVEKVRKEKTDPLNAEVKEWMDLYRPAAEVLTKAEALLKGSLAAWDAEQRRLAAIAAEEQRKREQADRERLQREQDEADKLRAEADALFAAGDIAAAEAVEEKAMAAQDAVVYIAAPATIAPEKPKGSSSRMAWKARIVDESMVPKEYWVINQFALDSYAKAMKENAKLPGVEFFAEPVISIR